ncbi:MAG: hypothetical protein JWO36_6528 [Myxococcales bacterium]|nr:hypothetical protein [Myxococcales bacterium]
MKSLMFVMIAARVAAANPDPAVISPGPPAEPVRTVPRPVAAEDVSGAPLPGDESGRVDAGDGGDSSSRRFARGALFVPRSLLYILLFPVGRAIWAEERYDLQRRWKRTFYNQDQTIGVYPYLWYETGFGATAGARFFYKNVFGADEELGLLAMYGGHYFSDLDGSFRTGHRLGDRLELEVFGRYLHRPRDFFFGIGNGSKIDAPLPVPIDPLTNTAAVETRFKERLGRVAAIADVRLWDVLYLRAGGAFSDYKFGLSSTGPAIDQVYDPNALIGFGGYRDAYTEGQLVWNSRDYVSPFEPAPLFSVGSLAAVYGGRRFRIGSGSGSGSGSDYWRYGIDLQRFFRIGQGPRVLSLRLHGEAVSGSIVDVPFNELPRLGGTIYLRGYQVDRFRDRVAAVGSVEYLWDLSRYLASSVFVDVGRVYPSFEDLSAHGLRVGFGVSFQLHTITSFLGSLSIATSKDGGVFVNVLFDPVYLIHERVRRR